jgi:hypothetical protein
VIITNWFCKLHKAFCDYHKTDFVAITKIFVTVTKSICENHKLQNQIILWNAFCECYKIILYVNSYQIILWSTQNFFVIATNFFVMVTKFFCSSQKYVYIIKTTLAQPMKHTHCDKNLLQQHVHHVREHVTLH